MSIEGKPLAKGVYGLHMLPTADSTTVIFSKASSSWGSYTYKESEDALRVAVKPQPTEMHEALVYEFDDLKPTSANVTLKWDKLAVPFAISINDEETTLPNIRNQMRGILQYSWEPWYAAASFCLERKINLEEALKWADKSISVESRFDNLQLRANILKALNRGPDAATAQAKALEAATGQQLYFYGRQLQGQKQPEEALEIFRSVVKRFPDGIYGTILAKARVASSSGDFATALKEAKAAQSASADDQQKAAIQALIDRLEKKEDVNKVAAVSGKATHPICASEPGVRRAAFAAFACFCRGYRVAGEMAACLLRGRFLAAFLVVLAPGIGRGQTLNIDRSLKNIPAAPIPAVEPDPPPAVPSITPGAPVAETRVEPQRLRPAGTYTNRFSGVPISQSRWLISTLDSTWICTTGRAATSVPSTKRSSAAILSAWSTPSAIRFPPGVAAGGAAAIFERDKLAITSRQEGARLIREEPYRAPDRSIGDNPELEFSVGKPATLVRARLFLFAENGWLLKIQVGYGGGPSSRRARLMATPFSARVWLSPGPKPNGKLVLHARRSGGFRRNPIAQFCIRQTTVSALQIIAHVLCLGGGGDRAGDRRDGK